MKFNQIGAQGYTKVAHHCVVRDICIVYNHAAAKHAKAHCGTGHETAFDVHIAALNLEAKEKSTYKSTVTRQLRP